MVSRNGEGGGLWGSDVKVVTFQNIGTNVATYQIIGTPKVWPVLHLLQNTAPVAQSVCSFQLKRVHTD